MASESTGFVWNLVAMSHCEEETPKNESHKQEEHKMVKKTSSLHELNSNDNPRNLITQVRAIRRQFRLDWAYYKAVADADRITKCLENKL